MWVEWFFKEEGFNDEEVSEESGKDSDGLAFNEKSKGCGDGSEDKEEDFLRF